jgi:uncharacterized membrane protein YedE/YeeE
MFELLNEGQMAALIGGMGGILLGLAARMGRFCTLGAIEDYLYANSQTRLRMWGLSIGVAMFAVFAMMGANLFDPTRTGYLTMHWNPLYSIIGGVMFGYGMALSGNCGYGALARLGGGDLRSFVIVLVAGISAFVVMSGPLAAVRVMIFPVNEITDQAVPSIAYLLADGLPISAPVIGMTIAVIITVITFMGDDFHREHKAIFWSIVVGVAIASGWAGTQWIADNGFASPDIRSHTFVAPVGDTIIYVMNGSALGLNFAIGSVAGVLAGAFLGSMVKGHFRWEACEDPRELRRQIIGAAIMGVGAILAFGCSVGQGITAFSLLAYSGPVTFAAIFLGARIGTKRIVPPPSVGTPLVTCACGPKISVNFRWTLRAFAPRSVCSVLKRSNSERTSAGMHR